MVNRRAREDVSEFQTNVVASVELGIAQGPTGVGHPRNFVQLEIDNAVVIPVVVGRDFTILSRQRKRRRAACDQCRAGDCYDGQMTLDEARRSEEGGHNSWLLTEVRANNKQRPKTPNACSGGRVGRNRFGSLQAARLPLQG